MPLTVLAGSSADQLKTITSAIQNYFAGVSTYIGLVSFGPLPMFEDVVKVFVYDEILRDAIRGEKLSANFATGALVDSVQFIIGILREFTLRAKPKAQYWLDSQAEYGIDAGYYGHLYPTYFNMYRGKSPEQT